MKKLTAILLTLVVVFTACSGDKNTTDNNSGKTGDNISDGGKNDAGNKGGISQSAMEKTVSERLSALGDPVSLTLCGGSSIEFEPENEIITMWGDSWTIKDPNMSLADLRDSVDSQLTAAGFIKDYGLVGSKFVKKAGVKGIGVEIAEDGSSIAIRMTHFAKDYNKEYIAAQEAIMPKIIPGISAEDVLPENFSITWKLSYGLKFSLIRKDGDWLYCSDSREEEGASDYSSAYYNVAIKQSDGSYKFYSYSQSNSDSAPSAPRESEHFTSTAKDFKDTLNNILDCEDGYGMDYSLSTWLQMSKDYGKAAGTESANMRHEISENMTIAKTEEIAGVTCDVAESKGWGESREYAYDRETGVLFRYSVIANDEKKDEFLVVEYDKNPSALGNFPGVPQ
jgi:hypothetical protein